MEFKVFKDAIYAQFDVMSKGELFTTDAPKDTLWEVYLSSFPWGSNPLYKERTEHACQCCRHFIRACGGVVAIIDNRLVSIWDIDIEAGPYQVVADHLSDYVKQSNISGPFRHYERTIGTDKNHQALEDGTIKVWEHFHFKLPKRFVLSKDALGPFTSEATSDHGVFKRSLEEITLDAAQTVLELIEQGSLYRGVENKVAVQYFIDHKKAFDALPAERRENWLWATSAKIGHAGRMRNTAIGTLLVDMSGGMGLDDAVRLFESKVAPTNYKRPTALITKSMIANAQKTVEALGIESALHRRYAVMDDITINNVLFADRSARKAMGVFDDLAATAPMNPKALEKVESVGIDTFISDILPKATGVELMVENRHKGNMMSLVAPVYPEAKSIFKWGNNFSWAYQGDVADSMKERVKAFGGKVDGVLRFSIQWNDDGDNNNDFDAHCIEPDRNHIYFANKNNRSTGGNLDVDIRDPGKKVAVENITWPDAKRMLNGEYTFLVHNYRHRGGKSGFTAEIEYGGQVYSYEYGKELRNNETVEVARLYFNKVTGIDFKSSLKSVVSSHDIWGVNTQQFQKVSMIMNSPNHWDGNQTGNKHYFFILEGCQNPEPARGFFNEFLRENLTEHRKVLEVLGSKLKTEQSDSQLSGLGFSSTLKNSVFCKVTGAFTRTIKIIF